MPRRSRRNWISGRNSHQATSKRHRRLLLEPLESRALLATVFISFASDGSENGPIQGGFNVGRDNPSGSLTVNVAISGTATPGEDHDLGESVTVQLNSGEMSKYFSYATINDALPENTETVIATITAGSYTIGSGPATSNITDNDSGGGGGIPTVTVTASDPSAAEPSDPGQFTFTRSSGSPSSLSISYTTSGSTATLGSDYTMSGTVVIPAYQTSVAIPVNVTNDSADEPNETVIVTLIDTSSYDLGSTSQATVTIADNDPETPPLPTVSVTASASAAEPNNPGAFTFTRSSSSPTGLPISYTIAVTSTATPGTDYNMSGSATIPANQTQVTVPVNVSDDFAVEGSETVIVVLVDTANYDLGSPSQATVTIADNDTWPTLSVSDASIEEGGILEFTVTVSGIVAQAVTVNYETSDGTAIAPPDYVAASGQLTFQPGGQTSQIVQVTTKEDSIYEGDEWMLFDLLNPIHATIQNGTAVGTIIEDDPEPAVTNVEGLTTDTVCSCGCSCTLVSAKVDEKKGIAKVMAGDLRNVDGAGATAVVGGDVAFAPGFENATSIEATLTFNGVAGPTMYYNPAGIVPGTAYRLAQQVNTAGLASGNYEWELELVAQLPGGGTQTQFVRGEQNVDNRSDSVFGGGWTPVDLDRIRPAFGGLQWQKGDGSSFIFKYQNGAWARPKGEPDFSTLTVESGTTYVLRKKGGETLRFDVQTGLLQSRTDRVGNVTTYNYADKDFDSQIDDVTSIVESSGHSRTFDYSSGRVVSITDQDGLVTALGYDPQARLTSITEPDPDGGGPLSSPVSYFSYDTAGNITSYTDAENNTTTFTYTNGMISSVLHPDGGQELFSVEIASGLLYPGSGGPGSSFLNPAGLKRTADVKATYTTEAGDEWEFGFNRFGQPQWMIDPLDNVTTYEFNHDGENLVTRIVGPDPEGPEAWPITRYEYDAKGNVTKAILPDGSVWDTTYEPNFSQPTSIKDGRGKWTYNTVDPANGNITSVRKVIGLVDPAGGESNDVITSYVYTTGSGVPKGLVQTMTDPLGRETAYQYDTHGNLTQVTLAQGTADQSVLQFGYDSYDHLLWADDAHDKRTDYVFDRLGRIVSTALPDPDGVGPLARPVYLYEHNQNNYRTKETDPLGRVTNWQYNSRNDVEEIRQPDHDNNGQLTITHLDYDLRRRLTTITDPLGRVTTLGYDQLDRNTTVTLPDPDGAGPQSSPVTTTAYDAIGRVKSVTDPLLNVTTYAYNDFWRQVTTTLPDPDGPGGQSAPSSTLNYDAAGNLFFAVDPLGRGTSYAYDDLNRLIMVTQPDPDGAGPLTAVTTYAYDKNSNLRFVTDPRGNVTETIYDFRNRPKQLKEADPDGAGPLTSPLTQFTYDAADRLLTRTNPLNFVTSFQYDAMGRLTTVTEPNAGESGSFPVVTTYAYDAASRLVALTEPANGLTGVGAPVTTYAYDPLDNLVTLTEADPDAEFGSGPIPITTFTYDAAGNQLSLTDPVGNTTTWTYDGLDRVIQETNQLSKTRTFKYDAVSNLIEKVDRLGRKTEYVYDNLYRNTAEKWYDGANLLRTLSFAYNANSQLISASDPAATYTYSYDALDRVTSEGQTLAGLTPLVNLTRSYDAASNLTQLAASIGGTADYKNTYAYDKLNRLTSLSQVAQTGGRPVVPKHVTFKYDAAGQMTNIERRMTAGSQEMVETDLLYSPHGYLTFVGHSQRYASGFSDYLANHQLKYDALGRVIYHSIDTGDSFTYQYDQNDQLKLSDAFNQPDQSFNYDANGNPIGGYTTGPNNQVLSDGTYNYTYDDEGNRLTKTNIATGEKEEYTWDHRNRLTKLTFKNSGGTVTKTVDRAYDVFNHWIRRTTDPDGAGPLGAQEMFLAYDGAQIVLRFDGMQATNLAHRYLWGPNVDQILADETFQPLYDPATAAGNVDWLLTDHQNTVYDVARSTLPAGGGEMTTTLVAHREYTAYGKLVSDTGAGTVDYFLGYTARPFDTAAGYQDNTHRLYDAALMRWLSEDPSGLGPDTNPNRYVHNSPTNLVDPNGLHELEPPRSSMSIDEILYWQRYQRFLDRQYRETGTTEMLVPGTWQPRQPEPPDLSRYGDKFCGQQSYASRAWERRMKEDQYRQEMREWGFAIQMASIHALGGFAGAGSKNPNVAIGGKPTQTPKITASPPSKVPQTTVKPGSSPTQNVPLPPSPTKTPTNAPKGGIIARNGTTITGYTKHGINRATGNGFERAGTSPQAILETLKNPKNIKCGVDHLGRRYEIFTGPNARVVVNPQTGEIISVNPLGRGGVRGQ